MSGNGTGGTAGLLQRVEGDVITIGKPGLLALDNAHTGAALGIEAGITDDTVFQHPGLMAAVLKIHVGLICLAGQFAVQQRRQLRGVQVCRRQQYGLGNG